MQLELNVTLSRLQRHDSPRLLSSLTSSAMRFDARVLGRTDYLNEKIQEKRTVSTSVIVSSKSASVSPGNPTMISVDRRGAWNHIVYAINQPDILLSIVAPSHRWSTGVKAAAPVRCRCLHTLGRSRTA